MFLNGSGSGIILFIPAGIRYPLRKRNYIFILVRLGDIRLMLKFISFFGSLLPSKCSRIFEQVNPCFFFHFLSYTLNIHPQNLFLLPLQLLFTQQPFWVLSFLLTHFPFILCSQFSRVESFKGCPPILQISGEASKGICFLSVILVIG